MSESLVERIKRLQGARDRTALPGAPTACTGPGPQAEILGSRREQGAAPAQGATPALEARIVELTGTRAEHLAQPDDSPLSKQLAKLGQERLLREAQGPMPPVGAEAQQQAGAGIGAANTSRNKHVRWHDFKRARADADGAATRRAPMRHEDSEEGSDDEVDDAGVTMGPMSNAPIERMEADNRKAAAELISAIGNIDCARRHFQDDTITGTQGDLDDYLNSIAASSRGYITMCKGRALGLEQYLIERDGPPDDGTMRIHGRVNSRAIIGFLNQEAKKGKTARQGAEAQIRKLKAWGFDLAVDTEVNANARKAAPKPTKGEAKPANPLDLDMVAHIGYGVADTSLSMTQRGCFAQMEIMQQGVLRHVNANRCGEITDRVQGEPGAINPDFFHGRVAVDAKKAMDKKYDKPFCAVKRTFTGFEYGATLIHSLQGVTHLGFLVRDLSAPSANPFEEGCTFLDKPMDRNRTLRMLGHLMRAYITYPDGRKQRPTRLERLDHLGVQAARHVLPAAAGARFESRRAIREIGIWSKSAAEETTVPGMGRLADLVTTVWGKDPDEDAAAHTTPDQYSSHGTSVALPGILLRQHKAISALILEHAADLSAIAGVKGWKLLHEAAWPTGFQRSTAVAPSLNIQGGQEPTAAILAVVAAASAVASAGAGPSAAAEPGVTASGGDGQGPAEVAAPGATGANASAATVVAGAALAPPTIGGAVRAIIARAAAVIESAGGPA